MPNGCDGETSDNVHLINLKPGIPSAPSPVTVSATATAAPNTVQVIDGYLVGDVDLTLAPGTAIGDQINIHILDIGGSGTFKVKSAATTILELTAPIGAPTYLRYQWSGTAWLAV
jgi:hypothetical protein